MQQSWVCNCQHHQGAHQAKETKILVSSHWLYDEKTCWAVLTQEYKAKKSHLIFPFPLISQIPLNVGRNGRIQESIFDTCTGMDCRNLQLSWADCCSWRLQEWQWTSVYTNLLLSTSPNLCVNVSAPVHMHKHRSASKTSCCEVLQWSISWRRLAAERQRVKSGWLRRILPGSNAKAKMILEGILTTQTPIKLSFGNCQAVT